MGQVSQWHWLILAAALLAVEFATRWRVFGLAALLCIPLALAAHFALDPTLVFQTLGSLVFLALVVWVAIKALRGLGGKD